MTFLFTVLRGGCGEGGRRGLSNINVLTYIKI